MQGEVASSPMAGETVGEAVPSPLVGETIGEEKPISLWMVRRSVFDNALAQRAAKAGAELRDGLAVRRLEGEKKGPIIVKAEGKDGVWEATAGTVLGADGANGIVARSVGLRRERALA